MARYDLQPGARVPLDRSLGLRVLLVGLVLASAALVVASAADLGAVVPADGAPLRSTGGLAIALYAAVAIATISVAYWPLTQTEVASRDGRSSGRLDDVGVSACLFWAPVVLPVISVVVGRGERLATALVASALMPSMWGLAEWVRRHTLVAGPQLSSERSDIYRDGAFFRPGFLASIEGVSVIGVAVVLYERDLSADFIGYWIGVSLAVVSAFTYVPQLVTWWSASDRAALVWSVAAVATACGLVVPAYLPHEPGSAFLGALWVSPFVVVMELWRRSHARPQLNGGLQQNRR